MTILLAVLAAIFIIADIILVVYVLASFDLFFTFVKEGTAKAVMRGKSFDHFLMSYKGHYLNDPRRWWFDNTKPHWEVLKGDFHSAYAWWKFHWRMLEKRGIYWIGTWPFYSILVYRFEWTEPKESAEGVIIPRHRDEPTNFLYVAAFVYWLKIATAEDVDNMPVDVDYFLTVEINNPYLARFGVTSWFTSISADANNAGKRWIAMHGHKQVNQELRTASTATPIGGAAAAAGTPGLALSGFVEAMKSLNVDLPTHHATIGAPKALGVTVVASALQDVNPAGLTAKELREATTAPIIATLKAEAKREEAKGTADANMTLANAEKYRIHETYTEIASHGELGKLIQQVDAIKEASKNPGSTLIWANDPLIPIAGRVAQGLHQPPAPTPQPSATPSTPSAPATSGT